MCKRISRDSCHHVSALPGEAVSASAAMFTGRSLHTHTQSHPCMHYASPTHVYKEFKCNSLHEHSTSCCISPCNLSLYSCLQRFKKTFGKQHCVSCFFFTFNFSSYQTEPSRKLCWSLEKHEMHINGSTRSQFYLILLICVNKHLFYGMTVYIFYDRIVNTA